MNTISKVVNNYFGADLAAGVGWRVPVGSHCQVACIRAPARKNPVLECGAMPVNSTPLEYDANVTAWLRARDVLAGADAVPAAGICCLPRLDLQTKDEYAV